MKIALLAEHVLMSVLLRLSLRATSTKLIRIFAPIVVHVQMFALLRQFILNKLCNLKKNVQGCCTTALFLTGCFFIADYILLSQEVPEYQYYPSESPRLISLFFIIYDSTILKPSHTAALPGDSLVK